MKTARGIGFSALIVVFLFPGNARSIAETNDSHAAGALFQRFETIFHINTNLLSGSGAGDFVGRPFIFLLNGLEVLSKKAPKDILDNADAILVGTKDDATRTRTWHARSTLCYILVLRDKSGLDIRRYFKQPVSSASVGPVWHWSATLEEFGEDYCVQVHSTPFRSPNPTCWFQTTFKSLNM